MILSYSQKLAFYHDGYVQVPGVVPQVMVDSALKAINHSIGQGLPAEEIIKMRAQSYASALQSDPVISDLLNKTPAFALAESLVGEGMLEPEYGGQIALRFPVMVDPPSPPIPHLDGMHTPTNGVPEGTIGNFTLLVGVLLSDLNASYSGNFTIWPGTHHQYEQYFRENTPQSLLNGMPPITLPEPKQVIGRAGDVILVHYELAHTAAPNTSPHVRYAVFFRLTHAKHEAQKWDSMTDIWLEFAGVSKIVAQAKQMSGML